ncbi:MAG: UDP-N-acetylmuramate dehydrogenase [Candidatus Latescibacteria bacterium]|nr:UDP-N-acetylmuramate dehydrogenase [Candidatus Latescibacterota bacterium]
MHDASKRNALAREIRARCRGELLVDEPLKKHTHFGMGGAADLFFRPADMDDLVTAVPLVLDSQLQVLALGGGTNILVSDAGFRGLVICLTGGLSGMAVESDQGIAQAGASLQVFSRRCQRAGRTGMEFGCGIPGTVGGAVWGNAGAWGGQIMERTAWLRGLDLRSGDALELQKESISFSYRRTDLPVGFLIVEAGFFLEEDDPAMVQARMDEMLAQRRSSQPLWERNAGCIFKNPPGTSAGLLIDKAGCKGLSVGDVEVSDVHANFIVNRGGGTSADVLSLAQMVQEKVRQAFGIEMNMEVRVVGERGIENP